MEIFFWELIKIKREKEKHEVNIISVFSQVEKIENENEMWISFII